MHNARKAAQKTLIGWFSFVNELHFFFIVDASDSLHEKAEVWK